MDWSEKNLCIKCNEGGNLMVCSENGCPLAIHEGCMGCPARFDDAGRFYCPYCLYKRAVLESRQAREYALARKKDLLIFMDEEKRGSEENLEENRRAETNGHYQPEVNATNANTTNCDDGKIRSNVDAARDQSIHLDKEQKVSDAGEENVEEMQSEPSTGSQGQDPKSNGEQKLGNAEEKQIQQEEHETSATDEQKISNAEEDKIHEDESQPSSASSGQQPSPNVRARHKRGSKRGKSIDKDPDAVSPQSKFVEQNGKNKQTSPTVNTRSSRRLRQPQQPPVKLENDTLCTGKRKRLLWTEEEEETLKAGVEKFAKEANKNLPWRKILEFGQNVFDRTRTPNDLRDKWRNMLGKM